MIFGFFPEADGELVALDRHIGDQFHPVLFLYMQISSKRRGGMRLVLFILRCPILNIFFIFIKVLYRIFIFPLKNKVLIIYN